MEKIQSFIREGKVKEAFEYCADLIARLRGSGHKDLDELDDELATLQNQWATLQKDQRRGTLTDEEYYVRSRKLMYPLLGVAREIVSLDAPADLPVDPPVTKILFLAANPKATNLLQLTREANHIEARLRSAHHRDRFAFVVHHALELPDLQKIILEEKPDYLHFSGHGRVEGIYVEDEFGAAVLVDSDLLTQIITDLHHVHPFKAIVFNSCLSMTQASKLKGIVPYVVGMRSEVGDAAALVFAEGFYTAIFAGASVPDALKLGCNEIQVQGLKGSDLPILF